MSKEQRPGPEEDDRTQAEREVSSRVHRHMGMTATVLVLLAVVVALARMRTMFGISPWEALGIGSSALPWILLIIGLGVFFSLGTTRIMFGIERLVGLFRGRKP